MSTVVITRTHHSLLTHEAHVVGVVAIELLLLLLLLLLSVHRVLLRIIKVVSRNESRTVGSIEIIETLLRMHLVSKKLTLRSETHSIESATTHGLLVVVEIAIHVAHVLRVAHILSCRIAHSVILHVSIIVGEVAPVWSHHSRLREPVKVTHHALLALHDAGTSKTWMLRGRSGSRVVRTSDWTWGRVTAMNWRILHRSLHLLLLEHWTIGVHHVSIHGMVHHAARYGSAGIDHA